WRRGSRYRRPGPCTSPSSCSSSASWSCSRQPSYPPSKDNRLAVEAKDLAVHVGDLTETGIIFHRVHQDRHHVAAVAARVRQLLEPPLDAAHVARGLEAADALDLLGFHALVAAEAVDRLLLFHHVLVDAHRDLLAAVVHQLVAVGGVGDLLLREAVVDRPDHAAHGVDLVDV